jgi:hypothetical protein
MSNDLEVVGSKLLPGGKAVEIINAPLRYIAPALQTVAQCRAETDALAKEFETPEWYQFLNRDRSTAYLFKAKRRREVMLPRAVQVRQAYDVLSTICEGGQNIDASIALKMLSVLQRVLIKKKDDPVTLMAFAGLFDQEIDDLGVSLSLWKGVPRHPVVVALAIQRLFHNQVFAPAPAELCSACRTVANRLKDKCRQALWWLNDLSRADIDLFKEAPDEWASLYTRPESFAAATAFAGVIDGTIKELIWQRDAAIKEMREGGADG